MNEARVPNYSAVPCKRHMSNPGQTCTGGNLGSCRDRRLLWVALVDAQAEGESGVWWFGAYIQITTPLR